MAGPQMHALRFNKLLLDLRKLGGRDLVIVGASVLDAALREALLRTLKPLSSKDREDMFDNEAGAARRLSAKIDLALATGIITKKTHIESDLVRRLRNELAHSIDPDEILSTKCSSLIGAFGYADPTAIDIAIDGVTNEPPGGGAGTLTFFGEVFNVPDLVVVMGDDRRVAWFYPSEDDYPKTTDDRIRAQLWACITASIAPVLFDWHGDEQLASQLPAEAWS